MAELEPVILQEDEKTGDRFLIFGTDKGLQIDIRYEDDTLWMTQAQIAELFGVTRQMVNNHLNNIYEEDELEREPTCKESLQVRTEGSRDVRRKVLIHNLDAVIAVGYRISSKQATLFRRWATDKLVQFAKKGFVIDPVRLKSAGAADHVVELREIIRDIRADEANVYRELRRICSMCQDYDKASDAWQEFYRTTQAKLLYAVTSHTPAEIIASRANAEAPNMGLTNWPTDNVRKQDVTVSKCYLADTEIKELNRLTTILLDIFEDQLDVGRLVIMEDARVLLDGQLKSLNRSLLTRGGSVKTVDAKRRAEQQYEIYNANRKNTRHVEADQLISELTHIDQTLPRVKQSRVKRRKMV